MTDVTMRRPCEDTEKQIGKNGGRDWGGAGKEHHGWLETELRRKAWSFQKESTLLTPWLWTSGLQKWEGIHFCCLSYPVCDPLLWKVLGSEHTMLHWVRVSRWPELHPCLQDGMSHGTWGGHSAGLRQRHITGSGSIKISSGTFSRLFGVKDLFFCQVCQPSAAGGLPKNEASTEESRINIETNSRQ